ncbi:MAG: di-trans,poly-cis-decaprenylcistransferase [Candidatus Dormibacteraeota bacterium]|nr:di-trans,poly-cis-decaprenylcistransferase [Candidatus Dormibacteraeota bacterium]
MHTAIIMDGNGRWAAARNLNRQAGHRAGARAVGTVVRAAARRGVDTLTLYAFSCDNWHRPRSEVEALFGLLHRYLIAETERCVADSIRVNFIGRRDRLTAALLRQIEHSERLTAAGRRMHLRIAVDYSSRGSIIEASRRLKEVPPTEPQHFLSLLGTVDHSDPPAPEVDLLIRTGGEQRLSDFLLWECAYAELYFVDCPWPDFDEAALAAALEEYSHRQRRFGRIAAASSADVTTADHG